MAFIHWLRKRDSGCYWYLNSNGMNLWNQGYNGWISGTSGQIISSTLRGKNKDLSLTAAIFWLIQGHVSQTFPSTPQNLINNSIAWLICLVFLWCKPVLKYLNQISGIWFDKCVFVSIKTFSSLYWPVYFDRWGSTPPQKSHPPETQFLLKNYFPT